MEELLKLLKLLTMWNCKELRLLIFLSILQRDIKVTS